MWTKLIHTFDQNGIRGIGKWSLGIMLSIHAKAPCELRAKLRDINPQVPRRTEGRRTEDCETWVSCHFLTAISKTDLLGYPLCIMSRDKPDLTLSSPSERTGIELTEAVSSNQARVDAYSEHNDIEELIHVPLYPAPLYPAGEEKFSQQRIENIARNQDPRQLYPLMGDRIERNWVKVMLYFARKKVEKFTKPGFEKYDRNWLLIYDNWTPLADLDYYPDAITALDEQLFNCDWKNPFDRVFILRSRHVLEFPCGDGAVKHAALDLWQTS